MREWLPFERPSRPTVRGVLILVLLLEPEAVLAAPLDPPPAFPRITAFAALENEGVPVEALVKYPVVSGTGRQRSLQRACDLRTGNRDVVILRHFPARAHQRDEDQMPLCGTYPGHWLFYPYATLGDDVTPTDTQIRIENVPAQSRFEAGYYAMIWDGEVSGTANPDDPQFWGNSEHVKIAGVNGTTLTVERGYGCGATNHRGGNRIAVHVPGAGANKDDWSYNQSTLCPRDGQGRRLNQAMAEWLAANFNSNCQSGAGRAGLRRYSLRHHPVLDGARGGREQ